jgi:hypothetical protein
MNRWMVLNDRLGYCWLKTMTSSSFREDIGDNLQVSQRVSTVCWLLFGRWQWWRWWHSWQFLIPRCPRASSATWFSAS